MRGTRICALALVIGLVAPAMGHAQGDRRQQGGPPQGRRGGAERQIGELIAQNMKLTDQQRPKFVEVTGRFMERERMLNEEERVARTSMRNLLCSGDTTRGPELARSLDQVLDLQKRRHQLIEEQQKELSTFLTPYQRARFLGSRELIMDRMGRGGRGGRMGPPPGEQGGPPPGGRPPGGPPPGARQPGDRMGPPADICAAPPPGQGRRGGN